MKPEEAVEKLNAAGSDAEVAALLSAEGIKGQRGCTSTCPVARYLRRETNVRVSVGHGSASFLKNDQWKGVPLSDAVVEFIRRFDAKEYPELIES